MEPIPDVPDHVRHPRDLPDGDGDDSRGHLPTHTPPLPRDIRRRVNGRLGLTIATPLASSNTYRQRYQIGKFFENEYNGQPVATGELGYATLFHDGTVIDLLGLGEVIPL